MIKLPPPFDPATWRRIKSSPSAGFFSTNLRRGEDRMTRTLWLTYNWMPGEGWEMEPSWLDSPEVQQGTPEELHALYVATLLKGDWPL